MKKTLGVRACEQEQAVRIRRNIQRNGIHHVYRYLVVKKDMALMKFRGAALIHTFTWNEHLTRMLLDLGADPNQSTKYGETPLEIASTEGIPEVIDVLIEQGATLNKTLFTVKRPSILLRFLRHGQWNVVVNEECKETYRHVSAGLLLCRSGLPTELVRELFMFY
jgi:hypothetical protein